MTVMQARLTAQTLYARQAGCARPLGGIRVHEGHPAENSLAEGRTVGIALAEGGPVGIAFAEGGRTLWKPIPS